MRSAIKKNALREIRGSFGRFFAILAIIALGVGFFTGVRITTPAMVDTVNRFLDEYQFYDYRLMSAIGWTDEDIKEFAGRDDVRCAEGAYSADFLSAGDSQYVVRAHSITDNVNKLKLISGRMPEKDDECVLESGKFGINTTITIAGSTPESIRKRFKHEVYNIVGWVESPMYINFERGNSSLGNGEVKLFAYFPKDAFDMEVYTEAYVRFNQDYTIYSDEYEEMCEACYKSSMPNVGIGKIEINNETHFCLYELSNLSEEDEAFKKACEDSGIVFESREDIIKKAESYATETGTETELDELDENKVEWIKAQ